MLRDLAERVAGSAAFAYGTIILLQLKVIWGMWQFRDLTPGDTSYYFVDSHGWYSNGSNLICWSPLYTCFYGSLLHISTDAYLVTVLHRVLIVLANSVLVLVLLRQLLPGFIAWLIAAWWAVLPANFDAMFEVHLFSLIPVLAACCLLGRSPSVWRRGAAFGILAGASLLLRNELVIATALLAVLLLWHETRTARSDRRASSRLVLAYGIPLALVGVLTLFLYARSRSKFPDLWVMLERKHTLNVCQIYAYGYQQRHSDWKKSSWTECQDLMSRVFGKPEPGMLEAMRRNPAAMLEHFLWNIRLIPNGLQVSLFNATSGRISPDYVPVETGSRSALVLSMAYVALLAAGIAASYRGRRNGLQLRLRECAWGWISLGAVCCSVLVVMVMQRPRPEYILSLVVAMMASAGLALHAITHHRRSLRTVAPLFPLAVVLLIGLAPAYYTAQRFPGRPLLVMYRRLAPFAVLQDPRKILATPGWGHEICNYLRGGVNYGCRSVSYWELQPHGHQEAQWTDLFEKNRVEFLYLDEHLLGQSSIEKLVSNPRVLGWEVLGYQNVPGQKWALLQKQHPESQKAHRD